MRLALAVACVLAAAAPPAAGQQCSRKPENLYGPVPPQQAGSGGFSVLIGGNYTRYEPGQKYTVKLVGYRGKEYMQKFEGFFLTVEAAAPWGLGQRVGHFRLYDDALTRFSDRCDNTVTHTSSVPKSEVTVLWTAPQEGSGCVVFRATVIEHRDIWYKDEGALSREMCEQVQENRDEQPPPLDACCACDEAKYEVTFEGLWSRHTHPTDFPQNEWDAAFSDIIGASHAADYRIWEYGALASQGVRQVAEWGDTKKLENELKEHSDRIRTIIKARGLEYPNLQSRTFAVFRVNREHHQASLLARLKPSPDWIVGVSAMELCLRNCSWAERRVLNLRPWDAGTSNGVTYLSNNIGPTIPQQKITRITSKSSAQSPFYDPTGAEIPPLARLVFQRQRVYERSCPQGLGAAGGDPWGDAAGSLAAGGFGGPGGAAAPGCATTHWSAWSACSASCGPGMKSRLRRYRQPLAASIHACSVPLEEQRQCRGPVSCDGALYAPAAGYGGYGGEYGEYGAPDPSQCVLTEWSLWTPCSVTCGPGLRSRRRSYLGPLGLKQCNERLVESEQCPGERPPCLQRELIPPGCEVTIWSEWSPCSVTCGEEGYQVRTREYMDRASAEANGCNVRKMEQAPCAPARSSCSLAREEAQVICSIDKDIGKCRNEQERWYYNQKQGRCIKFIYNGCRGNANNFETFAECSEVCEAAYGRRQPEPPGRYGAPQYAPPPDLGAGASQVINPLLAGRQLRAAAVPCGALSAWGRWGPCSATCGRGRQSRRRHALRPDAVCSERRLTRHRECALPAC